LAIGQLRLSHLRFALIAAGELTNQERKRERERIEQSVLPLQTIKNN
jgi:hypothetical protein